MNVKKIVLSHYHTVKKGKHIIASLFDYFLIVIFAFSLFSICSPLYQNFGFSIENQEKYKNAQDETISILKSTHLQLYNEDTGRFYSMQDSGRNYLLSLLKSSCYENEIDYFENENNTKKKVELSSFDSFSYVDENGYVNDSLAFYFVNFRDDNTDSFDYEIERYSIYDFNTKLLCLDSSNKSFVDDSYSLSSNFTLSKENSEKLMAYMNFNDSSGEYLYNQLLSMYLDVADKGIKEVENHYSVYKEKLKEFQTYFYSYTRGYDITIILCYTLAFLISYILFPLIFKRGRTISYRFLSLFPVRNDEDDLRVSNYIIKYIFLFLEMFSSVFFLPLFISKLNLLSSPFIGSITMFQLCVFSFLLSFISIIFSCISKDNQFLSEYASRSYVVDISKPIENTAYGQ